MTTKEQLTQFLTQKIPGFDPSQNLNQQLNSLELFSLVGEVEKTFAVSFYSLELTEENLRSVETWAQLIEKKKRPT